MRTVRGQFRLESNCQNALFCTPQCLTSPGRDSGAKRSIVQITKFTLESNYKVGDQLLQGLFTPSLGFLLFLKMDVLKDVLLFLKILDLEVHFS